MFHFDQFKYLFFLGLWNLKAKSNFKNDLRKNTETCRTHICMVFHTLHGIRSQFTLVMLQKVDKSMILRSKVDMTANSFCFMNVSQSRLCCCLFTCHGYCKDRFSCMKTVLYSTWPSLRAFLCQIICDNNNM